MQATAKKVRLLISGSQSDLYVARAPLSPGIWMVSGGKAVLSLRGLSTAAGKASTPNTRLTGFKTEDFAALFPETLRLVLLQISLLITRTILTEETLGHTDSVKKLNTTC